MLRQIASGAFGSVHCVQRRDSKVIHAAKYVNSAGSDLDREVKNVVFCNANDTIIVFNMFVIEKYFMI